MRRSLLAAALMLAAGAVSSPSAFADGSEQRSAHVDRQTYVTTTPVDPYAGDTSAIHVAAQAGQEQARSFVHFALGGDQLLDGTLDFTTTPTAGVGNVNTSAASIKACVLTQPLPPTVTQSNAPKADCDRGSVQGKPDGGLWSFALARLAPYLNSHANLGLALVPTIADPTSSWSISFDVLKTSATVVVTPARTAAGTTTPFGPPNDAATQPDPAPAPAALPPMSGLGTTQRVQSPAAETVTQPPAVAAPAPVAPVAAMPSAVNQAAAHRTNRALAAVLIGLLAIVLGLALLTSNPVAALLSRSVRPGPFIPATDRGSLMHQREIDAAVRRYIGKVARRYTPFVVGLLTLALIVVAVPTKTFQPGADTLASGSAAQPGTGIGAAPGTGAVAPGSPAGGPAGGTAAGTASGPGLVAGGGAGSAGPSAVSPQTAAAAQGAVGGVSRAGVSCTKGKHQVAWSTWTPYCQPAWRGSNGGTTSHGVSKDAITMTYRFSNTGQGAALQALAGAGSADISEENYLHDLQVYINYFNTQFELYGRKVVLKKFDGQGDYLQEYQGQNIPGAQADAQTARDLGAFGDMSFSEIVMTTPYAQALAAKKVMSLSAAPSSASTYRKMAPYAWNSLAMINLLGVWFGNLTCQRLAGLPAIFAPAQASKQRAFGLLHPDTPDFNEVGDITEGILKKCGVTLTKRIRYSPDLSKQSSDMSNAMVQLASSGTTTVLCLCDGTGNILATSAASSQQYYPEWITNGIADEDSQRFAKDQSPHAISPNGAAFGFEQNEALQVYKLADPSNAHKLPETILDWVYLSALMTFDGIQAAGPNLNPYTFQSGMWSLPPSLPYMQWERGQWDGVRALPVYWFDNNATSKSNGQQGAYRFCSGKDGEFRTVNNPAAYGPKRTQLHCFGR